MLTTSHFLVLQVVRHRPPPNRILLSRRYRRRHVFHPPDVEDILPLQLAAATRESRPSPRDRHEHPVPALLDAIPYTPRLVDQQAHDIAFR